jgi:hypothetical protein
MKRFVQGDNRTQSFLLPEALDDYVTDTNPVRVVDVFVDVNIPRQSEQGFHGKKNTNSTAKLMPIPRQKEQGFHAIANRVSGWRRRGSTVARSTVLSGVPNGKCQVDHAQNQGSAAAAFRV